MAPKPTRPTRNGPSEKRCTASILGISLLGLAEDAVDVATCVVDDLEDAFLLFGCGGMRPLEHRRGELAEAGPQIDLVGVGTFGDLFPRRRLRIRSRGPALVGELEKPLAAFGFGRDDQSLVDEQLQG